MTTLMLVGLLALVPAPDSGEDVIKALDADFQELLKKEKDPQPLRDAARLLAQTNQSDRWTKYMDAIALLRRHRSPAAVPLLLRYMLEHVGLSTAPGVIAAYADTLTILTGKDIANPYRYIPDRKTPVNEAVAKLVKDWWGPGKEKIGTDLAKMSEEQLRVVADRLTWRVTDDLVRDDNEDDSATAHSYRFDSVLSADRDRLARWWREDLHAAMVPIFLRVVGYVDPKEAKGPPAAETFRVPFGIIPLLAALRADGEAPQLDKLAADKGQNTAVRLTCLLALRRAGEAVKAESLLAILKDERKLERRLVATLALAQTADREKATPRLMELMDDPNEQVRTAAVLALRGSATKEALPRLKKVLDEQRPEPAVVPALNAIVKIDNAEARTVLAGFLKATLEDGKKQYLYEALWAFERATGQHWTGAGAKSEAYYQERARVALKWWDEHK
jgi:hypothetical protein